jgi:hypothetical protein
MPRYRMIVLSSPNPGREAEYNHWYQHTHLGEVLALRGFRSAQRFRLARQMGERETWPYAAIYEIETDDIDAVLGEVQEAAASGRLGVSDAIARELAYAAIYEEFGGEVTRLGNA